MARRKFDKDAYFKLLEDILRPPTPPLMQRLMGLVRRRFIGRPFVPPVPPEEPLETLPIRSEEELRQDSYAFFQFGGLPQRRKASTVRPKDKGKRVTFEPIPLPAPPIGYKWVDGKLERTLKGRTKPR